MAIIILLTNLCSTFKIGCFYLWTFNSKANYREVIYKVGYLFQYVSNNNLRLKIE